MQDTGLFVRTPDPAQPGSANSLEVIIDTDKTKHFNDFFSQSQTRISLCGISSNFVCRLEWVVHDLIRKQWCL